MRTTANIAPPQLRCRELPAFFTEDPAVIRAAFASADPCVLGQGWLVAPESNFMPATVHTGWRGNALLVFAELYDADIFTRATGHNQRMWELGDVLEIFLQPEGSESYVELHVTPANWRLQLRIPDAVALSHARAENCFDNLLLPDGVFRSRAWTQPENGMWFVLAEIPAATVCGASLPLAGVRWRFSFSRYDCSRDECEPVISSSSPHSQPDFHRREEWGTLLFT
jgi:hypothetical protein